MAEYYFNGRMVHLTLNGKAMIAPLDAAQSAQRGEIPAHALEAVAAVVRDHGAEAVRLNTWNIGGIIMAKAEPA